MNNYQDSISDKKEGSLTHHAEHFLCLRTKFPMAQETALTMRDKSGLVGVITSTGQMEDLKCIEYSHELESTN